MHFTARHGDRKAPIFIVLNSAPEAIAFTLPKMPEYKTWRRILNTTDDKPLVASPGSAAYTAFIKNDKGEPVAGYARRSVDYGTEFNRVAPGDQDFIGVGKGIIANGDGSYKLSIGIKADKVIYPAFRLEDHEGSRELNEDTVPYAATLMR